MPKPKKDRFVLQPPSVVFFKPQGIPLFQLDKVVLSLDEYEAIRLMDHEGLQQVEAAERMKVSRATCARILESAHRKIAEAITEGKAIRIEGGNFVLGRNRYRCRACSTSWEIPLRESPQAGRKLHCPHCQSEKVTDLGREVGLGGSVPSPGGSVPGPGGSVPGPGGSVPGPSGSVPGPGGSGRGRGWRHRGSGF